ncbi:DUF1510 family protein [Sporolactobacillus sp. THM7-7]|nr:DUF1510 family protein [Sporolactobacillus sp. THM7-7]
MRKGRGSGISSRVERRKNKADHLLNWAIGVVSLFILAIGCVILISVFHISPSDKTATTQQSHQNSKMDHKNETQSSSNASSDPSGGTDSESDNDQTDSREAGKVPNEEENDQEASDSSAQDADESHQASYDMGSPDWNAQIAAIAKATGIDADRMTVHWLGNGGTPNSSLARVSPKDDQSAKWVVHLVYKDGKWQADDVQPPQ